MRVPCPPLPGISAAVTETYREGATGRWIPNLGEHPKTDILYYSDNSIR